MPPSIVCTKVERPNLEKLAKLISNSEKLKIPAIEVAKLTRYLKLFKQQDCVIVPYKYSAKAQVYGRRYSGFGLQGMKSEYRHTIAADYYKDTDIVNAHCVILAQLCAKNNIKCEALLEYINNREDLLAKLTISRADGKDLFLSLMNGGRAAYRDYPDKPKWLVNFAEEIGEIHRQLCKLNPELYKACKKGKAVERGTVEGSTMNHLLCDIENDILVACEKFLALNGVDTDNMVLMHDGFMTPKSVEINLDDLSSYVARETGYVVKYINKPMAEAFDLSGFETEVVDVIDFEAQEDRFKGFEVDHFKILNPISYARILKDGSIKPESAMDFHEIYLHLGVERVPIAIAPFYLEVPFTKVWVKRSNIRRYEKADTYPPPQQCPEDHYNTWPGWAAEKITETGGSADMFVQHIKNFLPNEWHWFTSWLAWIIQNPGKKTEVCPILISEDGAGKGTIFEKAMPLIMGDRLCAHTNTPATTWFAKHAELRNGRSLVNIDDPNTGDLKLNADTFKADITGKLIQYERKGSQTVWLNNNTNFCITTNKDKPQNISTTDRRYTVLECCNKLIGKTVYFGEINTYLEQPKNIRAIYEYLLNFSLEGINSPADLAACRPQTQAYKDIKEMNRDKELLFLADYFEDEEPMSAQAGYVYQKFKEWLGTNNYKFEPRPLPEFSKYLKKRVPGFEIKKGMKSNSYTFNQELLEEYLLKVGVLSVKATRTDGQQKIGFKPE